MVSCGEVQAGEIIGVSLWTTVSITDRQTALDTAPTIPLGLSASKGWTALCAMLSCEPESWDVRVTLAPPEFASLTASFVALSVFSPSAARSPVAGSRDPRVISPPPPPPSPLSPVSEEPLSPPQPVNRPTIASVATAAYVRFFVDLRITSGLLHWDG